MKRIALFFLAAAMLLTGWAWADDTATADTEGTAVSRTLTGEWIWNHRDNSGPLEAVFTQTGEDTWDVSFHFTFRGEPHTYTGTAQGNLEDGSLEGRVQNENKRRTWTFAGEFQDDGIFHGTHREHTPGREGNTGTLTLSG